MSSVALRRITGVTRHTPADAQDRPIPYTTTETVLVLAAALVFVGGLIHVGAAVDHFAEFPLYTLVFCSLAAAQFAWAALLLRKPSRRVMLLGCGFELAIVALWVVSRTAGVPIAPTAWVPEEIGSADLVETIGECVAVIAVLSVVFSARASLTRALVARMAPILLALIVVSALFGTAAHAG
ncbi:MAG TPA: hypothetical protein VHT25_02975 [Solirubrobacteraceae bacterium]|jgi:hypothetical protein|nr:hypothetical protein [Solirubrobacteraceae bacterium]